MSAGNLPEEQRTITCPYCYGKGTLSVAGFEPGTLAWWEGGGGYGYKHRIPVEVIGPSKSGLMTKCKILMNGSVIIRNIRRSKLKTRSPLEVPEYADV